PLLVVLIGTSFLAYRANSQEWRGFTALFEPSAWAWHWPSKAPETRPSPPALALTTPKARPAPDALEPAKPKPPKRDSADAPNAQPPAPATPKPDADPTLEDIRREAEKTRERLAELERIKEEEEKRLQETEKERRQADRQDQLARRFRFR